VPVGHRGGVAIWVDRPISVNGCFLPLQSFGNVPCCVIAVIAGFTQLFDSSLVPRSTSREWSEHERFYFNVVIMRRSDRQLRNHDQLARSLLLGQGAWAQICEHVRDIVGLP